MAKFNYTDFTNGKYVIHTKTLEEAKLFEKYMRHNGGRPAPSDNWEVHMEDTCFNINACGYTHIDWYKNNGYTILEFEDFDWSDFEMNNFTKKDLKNGDVVKLRNGQVYIVVLDTGTLVATDGYINISSIDEYLNIVSYCNNDFDIIQVRRPLDAGDCQFNAFDYDFGELVFERKEVEEMTLAEVCKALGKEIKIVKEK